MKPLIAIVMTTTLILGLGVAMAQAQNRTRPVSLGEVARQLKAQRAKSGQKPRVFTNDDLVGQPTSVDQSTGSPAMLSSTSSEQAEPAEKATEQTSANQTGQEPAEATQAATIEETRGENYRPDPMSKLQDGHEGKLQAAKVSPSHVKPARHPAPLGVHARWREARHNAASAPTRQLARTSPRPAPKVVSRESAFPQVAPVSSSLQPSAAPRQLAAVSKRAAKTNPRPAPQVISRAGAARHVVAISSNPQPAAPRQIAAVSSSSQPSPRQDLGYVEKADGRVEAIVAEGEHVRLVQEAKSFVTNFRAPAHSPANVEAAHASPPPTNPPASLGPNADAAYSRSSNPDATGSPSAAGEVDAALQPQPEPIPGDNAGSESEASATMQSEPLADYASDQFHAKPPETLQAPPPPVLPPTAPEEGVTHSTVTALGYVEKAGGEREAIVEVLGQIYLVHEGELFADKYRALHVTPSSVEIVEEPTEATAALPEHRRKMRDVRRPPE